MYMHGSPLTLLMMMMITWSIKASGNQTVWDEMLHQHPHHCHENVPAFELPITFIQQMAQLLWAEYFNVFLEAGLAGSLTHNYEMCRILTSVRLLYFASCLGTIYSNSTGMVLEWEEEITKKVQERRLKRYGNVMRGEEHYVGRTVQMKVQGRRKRERPKRRWLDKVKDDITGYFLGIITYGPMGPCH